jgi:hypothetical protein
MRQVGLATLHYNEQFKKIPPARGTGSRHSFFAYLLPFLEEKVIADRYQLKPTTRWDDATNAGTAANPGPSRTPAPVFVCASVGEIRLAQDKYPVSDFTVIIRVDDGLYNRIRPNRVNYPNRPPRNTNGLILDRDFRRVAKVLDGMANTILLTECAGRPQVYRNGQLVRVNPQSEGGWADPENEITLAGDQMINYQNEDPSGGLGSEIYSFHPGGANFVIGDGTIRFITDAVDRDALLALVTAADGDTIDWSKVE